MNEAFYDKNGLIECLQCIFRCIGKSVKHVAEESLFFVFQVSRVAG